MLVLAAAASSVPVLVVGLLTLAVSVATAYLVDAADKVVGKKWQLEKNEDGVAGGLAPLLREAGKWIADSWIYLNSKFPNDYRSLRGAP